MLSAAVWALAVWIVFRRYTMKAFERHCSLILIHESWNLSLCSLLHAVTCIECSVHFARIFLSVVPSVTLTASCRILHTSFAVMKYIYPFSSSYFPTGSLGGTLILIAHCLIFHPANTRHHVGFSSPYCKFWIVHCYHSFGISILGPF